MATRRVGGVVVAVALLGSFALLGAGEAPPSDPGTTTSTVASSTTTSAPPGEEVEPLVATTQQTYTFVDATRPTPCTGAADRTLSLTVVYPSTGSSFPVVLVGPGSGASQRAVARADAATFAVRGYLSVALAFPCTNAPGLSTTDPEVALDIYRQPGDVSFVLSSLVTKSETIGDELFGLLDPDRVGYTGTSSGGVTGLLLFNTCCADPRIDAVAAAKAFPVPTGGGLPATGIYDWARPIALYQWNACFDVVTPYEPAYDAFLQASPPKLFVQDPTGDHSSPVVYPAGTYEAFFDRYVAHDPSPALVDTLVGAGGDPYYAFDLGVPGLVARTTLPVCMHFTG